MVTWFQLRLLRLLLHSLESLLLQFLLLYFTADLFLEADYFLVHRGDLYQYCSRPTLLQNISQQVPQFNHLHIIVVLLRSLARVTLPSNFLLKCPLQTVPDAVANAPISRRYFHDALSFQHFDDFRFYPW